MKYAKLCAAVIALALGAYVAIYFAASTTRVGTAHLHVTTWRLFPRGLPLAIWSPLGWLESRWSGGMPIVLTDEGETEEIWCE